MLPATQDILCYFVAFLRKKGQGHSTIKTYLASVRSLQVDYGFKSPFEESMPKLSRILQGVKMAQGKAGQAPQKKRPITPTILC